MYENDGWSASFAAFPPAIETRIELYPSKEEHITELDSPQAMFDDYNQHQPHNRFKQRQSLQTTTYLGNKPQGEILGKKQKG